MAQPPIKIEVKIDADRATAEFKEARKEITRRRRAAHQAAADTVVPEARRRTPSFASRHIVATATARSGFVTTRGLSRRYQRALGLLEFGGVVNVDIRPKDAEALKTPYGPRAAVRNPRKYGAKRMITGAVMSRRDQIDRAILEEHMKAFDEFETS